MERVCVWERQRKGDSWVTLSLLKSSLTGVACMWKRENGWHGGYKQQKTASVLSETGTPDQQAGISRGPMGEAIGWGGKRGCERDSRDALCSQDPLGAGTLREVRSQRAALHPLPYLHTTPGPIPPLFFTLTKRSFKSILFLLQRTIKYRGKA